MNHVAGITGLPLEGVLLEGVAEPFALAFHRAFIATLVVDPESRVLALNDEARAILDKAEALRIENGLLVARERSTDRALQAALAKARLNRLGSDCAEAVPVFRRRGLPLILHILPALCSRSARSEDLEPAAVIGLYDPDAAPSVGSLGRQFGFSRDETALTEALLGCRSVGTACTKAGIDPVNAQPLMKGIYEKTGAQSVADLTRLFLLSDAPALEPQLRETVP